MQEYRVILLDMDKYGFVRFVPEKHTSRHIAPVLTGKVRDKDYYCFRPKG